LKQIEDYLRGGINLAKESGYSQKVKITNVTDDVLKEWIDKLARGRVLVKTGGDEELMMAIAYKRVPLADTFDNSFKILTPKTVELDGVVRNVLDGPQIPGRGSLIDMGVDPTSKKQIFAVV
jgi:hypothetical protein